jgi:hypothetical protein
MPPPKACVKCKSSYWDRPRVIKAKSDGKDKEHGAMGGRGGARKRKKAREQKLSPRLVKSVTDSADRARTVLEQMNTEAMIEAYNGVPADPPLPPPPSMSKKEGAES